MQLGRKPMGEPRKGNKAPPPMLCPVAREDSVEKLGVQITDNGTLQIDLQNGQHIAVRPVGISACPPGSGDPTSSGSETCEFLGKIQWTDLKMGHIIGEGSQAKVRKVKHLKTGNVYALKIITLGKQVTKRTLQLELSRVLTISNHPNVVASTEAFYIDGALKVLMEFMDLGTLQSISKQIGPIPDDALSVITKQILDGLDSLHSSDIVHRDIKPSNLLVNSQGFVKISDFGVSTFVNSVNPFAVTLIGSTAYMSPERVRADKYDAKSDIWSVGLTVAQCALGVFPFYTETPGEANSESNPFERKVNMFDLAALIAECRAKVDFDVLVPKVVHFYPDRPKPVISDELKDFVAQTMQQVAADRPSCKELMSHPFILKHLGKVDLRKWFKEHGVTPPHKDKPKEHHHHHHTSAHGAMAAGASSSSLASGGVVGTPATLMETPTSSSSDHSHNFGSPNDPLAGAPRPQQ